MSRGGAAIVIALLSSGCGTQGTPDDDGAIVRDSAGVTIVENLHGGWADGWRVEREPAVRIGEVEGDRPYLLDGVGGVARLSDGRIVVLDGASAELRFYDEAGRFLQAVGGRGEGPGEITGAAQLVVTPGDTLSVRHLPPGMVSRFDGEGRFIDGWRLDRELVGQTLSPGQHSELLSLLPGGGFLAPFTEPPPPEAPRPEGYRRPGGYVVVSSAGIARLLEPFPGSGAVSLWPPRSESLYAAGGSPPALAIGDNARYQIFLFGIEGELTRLVRRPDDPRPVRPEHLADLRRLMEEVGAPAATLERWDAWEASPRVPEQYPAFERILIDRSSHLWVRRYPVSYAFDAATAWDVFDPEGVYLGEVELPVHLYVHDIGEDFVLGVFRDPLGVERIHLHPLNRAAGGSEGSRRGEGTG